MSRLGSSQPIPAIKISTRNPSPPPSWTEVTQDFRSHAREFVYHEGRFHRTEAVDSERAVSPASSVVALVADLLRELIEGWFVGPSSGNGRVTGEEEPR